MTCKQNPVGRMKHRVEIQSVSRSSDGQGGFTESWSTDTTVWASLEPLKGFEKFQGGQTQTPLTHLVTMRYRTGVTTKNRIAYGDRVFDIKEAINVDEDNVFLALKCIEQA
jgi:SPP1 family predicted phage head-tail adaptor